MDALSSCHSSMTAPAAEVSSGRSEGQGEKERVISYHKEGKAKKEVKELS
jgi:hypothetical protein